MFIRVGSVVGRSVHVVVYHDRCAFVSPSAGAAAAAAVCARRASIVMAASSGHH